MTGLPASSTDDAPSLGLHGALAELAQLDKSDLDAALRHMLAVAARQLAVGRVSYWELASDHSAIRCRALYVVATDAYTDGAELRVGDHPSYFKALLEYRTIVIDDVLTDPRTVEFVDTYMKPFGIGAMFDVPVWRAGTLAGVICHEHLGGARTWSSEEQHFGVGIANMISVAIEASERKRAQDGYAFFAQATSDVLWDWDLIRDRIEWNEALCTILRHAPEDRTTTGQWWIDRIHPEDRADVSTRIHHVLAHAHEAWNHQYRFLRGDGSVATVIDRGSVVRDALGRPLRMVGVMLDVTERVEMQSRLALSDRMASIGTLAAGVAHEINNPLTYIMSNVEAALEALRAGPPDVPALRTLMAEALEGAERVRRIVRDLQVFSRPREDDVQDLEVASVIDSSINMAHNEIRHRAQLVKAYGPAPRVRMNRARLGQVVLNLLVNAAHAIREGNASQNEIRIQTSSSAEGHVVIAISDTGHGIPDDVIARVFEPFFTTKPVGVGTGLGLSICHSIISAAGGWIEVESPPGAGCTVRVVLPGVVDVQEPEPAPVLATPMRRRILVVDDEAPLRRAVSRMLQAEHDVVVADSGESALQQVLDDGRFDAIVCDLMMPRMTGMELYERLVARGSPLVRQMIFMTGGAFSSHASAFIAGCERPMLEKPFDRTALTAALANL